MIATPTEIQDYTVFVFNEYLEYDHQFTLKGVKTNPDFILRSIDNSNFVYFYYGFDALIGKDNEPYRDVLIDLSTRTTKTFPYSSSSVTSDNVKIHHYMGKLFTNTPKRINSRGKLWILCNLMKNGTWNLLDFKPDFTEEFQGDPNLFEMNTTCFKTFIIGIYGDTMYLGVMDATTVSVDLNTMKITSKFIIQEQVNSSKQMQIVDKYCIVRKQMTVFPCSELFCVCDITNWNRIAILKTNNQIYDERDFTHVESYGISCSLIGTTLYFKDALGHFDAFETTGFGKESSSEVFDPVMSSDGILLVSFPSSCVFFKGSGKLVRYFARYDDVWSLYTVKKINPMRNYFQDCAFQHYETY